MTRLLYSVWIMNGNKDPREKKVRDFKRLFIGFPLESRDQFIDKTNN